MTQVFFGASTVPLETDLDANFTELYTATQLLQSTSIAVGIGAAPSAWGAGFRAVQLANYGTIYDWSGGTCGLAGNAYYNGTNWVYRTTNPAVLYQQGIGSGQHQWYAAPVGAAGATPTLAQVMTLDNGGNLLVGQTAAGAQNSNSMSIQPGTGQTIGSHASGVSSGAAYSTFAYGGTTIGSVTQNGSTGVAYNTSSDYRLKSSVAPIAGSGAFIDSLKPCTWTWKSDGTAGAGFIAHELQAVSPASVTGTKDAVDAEGKPVYQSVEYGSAEVIAMLVAEVQSLRARLTAHGL